MPTTSSSTAELFVPIDVAQVEKGDAIYVPGWGPLAVLDAHDVTYQGSPQGSARLFACEAMFGPGEKVELLRGTWESITAYKGGANQPQGRFARSG